MQKSPPATKAIEEIKVRNNLHIHDDLAVECVWKSWSLLFENPPFMNMPHNHFIFNKYYNYGAAGPPLTYGAFYLCSSEKFGNRIKFDLPPPFQEDGSLLYILSSVCILCIGQDTRRGVINSSRTVLWNPATSDFMTEKAYLKQPKVFLCSKKSGKGKRPGKGGNRFWKSVGLGFKTPKEAIEGTFIDKKCPFTGNVSIRGRIIAGTCHSAKMNRTIIVRRNYLHFIKKYQRYEKRHSNIPAHVSPAFRVKEGDHVIIGQCRPLSKTVRFNVLKVIPAGSSSGAKKAFSGI
ncbi:hypothetical protein KIW84_025380 [Lathyrus oleraceus]|uniref:Small ribosomal subunit protein uS17 n=1 Tax=Pisum sativum TaxID=3888 RepID=A0A9D4YI70_PEA|nr:hypothetical protein KIW84_025380 [Pisum sativum]